MSEARPPINPSLTLAEFASWYWLKTELVEISRTFALSKTGSKLELTERIRQHLSGSATRAIAKRRAKSEMPSAFTPKSVIGKGWRCNPALGAYMRKICGNGFHFNPTMRDFIHNGAGRTLAEAVVFYRASMQPDNPKRPIPRQLEYNQHFRDFFAAHPGATRQQAIDAWWEKRSRRMEPARASTDIGG